ncbi:septal ring lytic transglycosylase RlpA family protein [Castellaniella sp.]|jgi:rare lipoprotein A|uniref:septal ring lytic transglycosylase RlpA family protein n=1 Tax=Castellaniella sp. TaxID=1955812 RepID=UPI002D7FFA63|nr:septal ring lytic transglycosylase RlpA family protein [Castellaniella sp.]HET8703913.1 septal ring lytic transglycosylase RlpA family protein [Castellaniella sp.]
MNAPASLWHQETVALRIGRLLALGLLGVALAVLAGCASRSGGYYKDDGPGRDIPANIDAIPDAVPRIERHAPANFRPYEVFGVRYIPIAEDQPYRQEGVASWYGRKFHGEKTANGETYDMYAMTAAHPTLPIPSYARVTRVGTGRSVIVRINDRGPFHPGRIIDLSYVAAAKLGLIGPGSGRVVVQAITNADIRAGRYPAAPLVASAPATPAAPPPDTAQTQPVGLPASPAALPTPQPASPAAGARQPGGIYLQFGAFSSAQNAQALATRVNIEAADLAGSATVTHQPPLYKVRMGPYLSRDEAAQTASRLAESAGLNPVIALDQGL